MSSKLHWMAMPTTQWTLLRAAGSPNASTSRYALDQILRRYYPALCTHLLARGIPEQEVEDLVQAFIASKVLEQNLLAQATPTRGRFRNLVLTALDRFIVSERRYQMAVKRGGGKQLALDLSEGIAAPPNDPVGIVEREWVQQLLKMVLDRMFEECQAGHRLDVWGVFEARVLHPLYSEDTPLAYEDLVRRYGLSSPTQAANVLVTGKRMFARLLREVISEYEPNAESVEAEINALHLVLKQYRAK